MAKGIVLYHGGGADRKPKRRGGVWRTGLRWIGNGLLGAGLAILLATGGYYAYSYYSLGQLEQEIDSGPPAAYTTGVSSDPENIYPALATFLSNSPVGTEAPPPPASTTDEGIIVAVPPAAPSGIFTATRIIIPSIEVDSKIIETGVVFEDGEWQWERPKDAVGHLVGTGNPGQPGNIVMSGHISSPQRGEGEVFKRLPDIKLGDVVILYTPVRAFAYQVAAKKVVLPTEVSVLDPAPVETLTLITCVPDLIYSHRLIVTAKRISSS